MNRCVYRDELKSYFEKTSGYIKYKVIWGGEAERRNVNAR